MSRTARLGLSIVLAVVCAMLPLVLDQCVASCEAHFPAAPTSAPSCHHDASLLLRVGGMPAPCGHDHRGPVIAFTVTPSPSARTLVAAPAVTDDPLVAMAPTAARVDVGDPISPPAAPEETLALPLRL